MEEKKRKFHQCVEESIKALPDDVVRKYCGKVYGYIKGYLQMEEEGVDVSYANIERFQGKQKTHRTAEAQEYKELVRDVETVIGVEDNN